MHIGGASWLSSILAHVTALHPNNRELLQRNISSQAEFARLTTERANIRARQDTLDKLTSLGAVPRLTMDSFIEHTMTLVEHLLG